MTDVAPRYQTVKQHILDRIAVGDWPPGARIPS
jgi:DNA-binding GntR family transcriptional regulator